MKIVINDSVTENLKLFNSDLNIDNGDGGKCAMVSTEGAIGYWFIGSCSEVNNNYQSNHSS